jgi:hypothetical protein
MQVKKIRLFECHDVAQPPKRRRDLARAAAPKRRQFVRTRKVLERAYIARCGDSLETVSLERGGQWLHEILQRGANTSHEEDAVSLPN